MFTSINYQVSFKNTFAMGLSFWMSQRSHTKYSNTWDSAVFAALLREDTVMEYSH